MDIRCICSALALSSFTVLCSAPGSDAAEPSASGTGFFINSEGWIVTNAHVLEGCSEISVPRYGVALEVHLDRQNDLAALRVQPSTGTHALPLRNSPPRLGEDVAAMGYPLARVLSSSVKITTGNINSLVGLEDDTRYLQVSTPIQPGNSGGPLLDRRGAVVGVTTSSLAPRFAEKAGFVAQNVNFAIRSNVLEIFLQSRGIESQPADTSDPLLTTADLAETAAPSVHPVLCFQDSQEVVTAELKSVSAEGAEPEVTPEIMGAAFALAYHDAWSAPNDEALSFMQEVYSVPIDFYGNSYSAAQVMREKRNFAERWPVRDYSIRDGSLDVTCSSDATCTVSAVVDWFAHSDSRSKSASGVAEFEFDLRLNDLTISRETGRVLKNQVASPAGLLERWHQQNTECRGGSGDDPETDHACHLREDTYQSLLGAGWCYGREGEYGYQMEWHRCEPRSLR